MSVLLLSGGLDSAVLLASEKDISAALFVDYGQDHALVEGDAARRLAARYGVRLYEASIRLPFWRPDPEDLTMLVPGRNLILISLAAAIGPVVVIGCNAADYEVYPDCRPEFFEKLASTVVVRTPLIALNKTEIGRRARELGIAPKDTWSCYYPRLGRPCGECDACKGRVAAGLSEIYYGAYTPKEVDVALGMLDNMIENTEEMARDDGLADDPKTRARVDAYCTAREDLAAIYGVD